MKSLIIGASGKIGKYYLQKKSENLLFHYFKNKIHKGIIFNLLKDDINKIIKKYNITSDSIVIRIL